MKERMKKMLLKVKGKKGFTLVEMIVVMAIIGILVALLAPNVATLIKDAQDTSNDAKVKNVMTTLSAYNTKMIKDGFQYKGVVDKDFDDDTNADGSVITVTATNFNETVQKLWENGTAGGGTGGTATAVVSTVQYIGKSSGYLPANALNGQEKMYLYLTKEGNVLGVCYTDGNDYVKALNTTLAVGDGGISIVGATDGEPANSSTARNKKTVDGLAFTN